MCRKWIRLTPEEAEEYVHPDCSRTGYGNCPVCLGRTILYLVHVPEGEGEALCIRCGKDVDAPMICVDQCRIDRIGSKPLY
jgi:hypothetical protein